MKPHYDFPVELVAQLALQGIAEHPKMDQEKSGAVAAKKKGAC